MINLIQQYHTPDQRWTIWKADSYESFIKKFMVLGKFHKKVPSVVVDEYKIVERLLCYSYYHYPLLDEAFSKLTRVFESSIKLRQKELGLPIKENEPLEKRLKKIEPFTSPTVFQDWHKVRKIRNYFAHPEAGKYMGITIVRGFYQMINIINLIFLDKSEIESNESLLDELKKSALHFKEGLYILQYDGKKYLIWSFLPYSLFRTSGEAKSFWVFHPVLKYFPQTVEKLDFSLPLYLNLKNIAISNNRFEATILDSGEKIIVSTNLDPLNQELLKKHREIVFSSELKVKEIYWYYLETELSFALIKFLYEECWE